MAITRWRHVYFSPDDDIAAVLHALPGHATRSLDIECYSFTDPDLVASILDAARRGVAVRVLADRSQSTGAAGHAALQALVDARLPNVTVRIAESERGAIDHLKMLIVDGVAGALADESSVASGSYNLSRSAQDQDNSFAWLNDPGEVAQAQAKFDRDWRVNRQLPAWQLQPTQEASHASQ